MKKLKKLLRAFWDSLQVEKEDEWKHKYGVGKRVYRPDYDPTERYVPTWVTYLLIALVCAALAYFGLL
jgi:hypothetical protein